MSRVCPHCAADVPQGALACPDCGSDAETGWSDSETQNEARWGAFTDEDYEEVLRDLPGAEQPRARRDLTLVVIAAVTLLAFLLAFVL